MIKWFCDRCKKEMSRLNSLENTINKSIQNDSYKIKAQAYKQSKFYITSAISELVNQGQNTAITRTNEILSSWDNWTRAAIEEGIVAETVNEDVIDEDTSDEDEE